jgi:hypothetical protein
MIGGAKVRPGLINNASGVNPDDLTFRAWEAGFLPEHADRPGIQALFDKIEQDIRGTPVYRDLDHEPLERFNHAARSNAEIDRLAAELGIDTAGKTRIQFMDEIAERMSVEAQAREMLARDEADDAAMREAMEAVRSELGDAWEGEPTEYDISTPRTLEDLLDELRRDQGPEGAQPGAEAGGAVHPGEPPGTVAGGEGQAAEGDRPGGGLGAAAGRDDAAAASGEPDRLASAIDAGGQHVIPGTERISDRALAERRMAGRLSADVPQKPADEGLFDVAGRGQSNLFDRPDRAVEATRQALDAAAGKPTEEAAAITRAADTAATADRRDPLGRLQDQIADLEDAVRRMQDGGELPRELPELAAADETARQAEQIGRAYEQAATCMAIGGL